MGRLVDNFARISPFSPFYGGSFAQIRQNGQGWSGVGQGKTSFILTNRYKDIRWLVRVVRVVRVKYNILRMCAHARARVVVL